MTDRTWPYVPYDESDETYFGCDAVVRDEWNYVRDRRERHDPDGGAGKDGAPASLRGIALSGGGIRSASFCLGILQALSYAGWLRKLDYVSMVSGGGYIGGSLAWLLHGKWKGPGKDEQIVFGVDRDNFPFGSYPMVGMSPRGAATPPWSAPDGPAAGGQCAKADTAGVRDCYKGRLLRYLRQHASYLMPGDGINAMSLLAVMLRNTLFSIVAYGGLLVGLFCLLGPLLFCQGSECLLGPSLLPGDLPGANINGALVVAAWLALLFLVLALVYPVVLFFNPVLNTTDTGYVRRHGFERGGGRLLVALGLVLVVGAVPYAYDWLQSPAGTPDDGGWWDGLNTARKHLALVIGGLSTLVGGISTLLGYLQAGKSGRIPTGVLVAIGSVSLIFGLLVLAYATAAALVLPAMGGFEMPSGARWSEVRYGDLIAWPPGRGGFALIGVALFFLALLRFANLNYLSIHRYYRDRLMETFTPDLPEALSVNGPAAGSPKTADRTCLKDVAPVAEDLPIGPYPIINANVVLVSSRIPKFRGRGGDNFILTPRYCGSNATGWCSTGGPGSPFAEFTLPTAIATSGAAIDPNTGCGGEGVTRSPFLSFLMGFFNVRLGYWVENPTPPADRMERIRRYLEGVRNPGGDRSGEVAGTGSATGKSGPGPRLRDLWTLARHRVLSWPLLCGWGTPNVLYPGLSEIYLRANLDENSRMVQLSDGGHFENLGLYELVRRRLRLIIVCDGAAHPTFAFEDLGNAIEKVRADFGALIDIDCEDLKSLIPGGGAAVSDKGAAFAKKGYLSAGIKYNDHSEGTLIYLTATFFERLSADLYAYRKAHGEFPNQSTADQFFDEKQFEAYRELGYQTAYAMMSDEALVADRNVSATVGRPDVRCYRELTRRRPAAHKWRQG